MKKKKRKFHPHIYLYIFNKILNALRLTGDRSNITLQSHNYDNPKSEAQDKLLSTNSNSYKSISNTKHLKQFNSILIH